MVRKNPPSRKNSQPDRAAQANTPSDAVGFDVQKELDRVEEIIISESFHIPLTRLNIIDEEKLLHQIDLVRYSLPEDFKKAQSILTRRQQILQEAEDYAQQTISAAQQRAAQLLDESTIIQQAEREANQIWKQLQQECEALQRKTTNEVAQMRGQALAELEQMRQQTLAECDALQKGADQYAEAMLNRLEQHLSEMLQIVRNGRQQL